MKLLNEVLAGVLATSLVAGLCVGGVTRVQGEQEDTRTEQANVESVESPPQSVEEAIQETTDDATAERRKKLVDDAVKALDQTNEALKLLEDGDTDAALESLALATGKLELVVARNPGLALAPVDVRLITHDLYATVDAVESARKRALDYLEDGRVQDARQLIEGLRSDVVVEAINVPLATYPAAIKAITPLIDAGEVEKAKSSLQQALNTLVVTQHVHPLPIIRTEHMLTRAEELATTEERNEEQNEELTTLLDCARKQLEYAQALGYGEEEDFESFYEQLDEIVRKTSGGRSGSGFFDRIRNALTAFGSASSADNTQ